MTFVGLGEAGGAFATPIVAAGLAGVRAYDRKGLAAVAVAGVEALASNAEAVAGAGLILSLVTADQALAAARETAATIAPGALYCDGNSVAPATKAQAAAVIEDRGGDYVDVAVMAPVHPLGLGVPLLLAGAKAGAARDELRAIGFTNVEVVGERVGQAASIKMIRSVMVKGIEAVVASLDASWKADLGWGARIEGSLERIARHGLRRAAEMDEVAATLASLDVDNRMALATAAKQRGGVQVQQGQAA